MRTDHRFSLKHLMPGLSENFEGTELNVSPLFWTTRRIKKEVNARPVNGLSV